MRREADHQEASEALAAAALDALAPDDQAAVLAHVDGCPDCARELAELREATAHLAALAVPTGAPDRTAADIDSRLARVRSNVLARAAAAAVDAPPRVVPITSAASAPVTAPLPRVRSARSLGLVAGMALAVAASLVAAITLADRAVLQREVVASRAAAGRAAAALAASERQLALVTGPQVAVVSLTASGAPKATALMFWDRSTDTWSMYAHNLPQTASGRTYELWLITAAGRKIPAGTFAPTSAGTAHVQATYALGPADLQAVAVTEEPAGGVDVATGPVVIAGTLGGK